MITVLDFVLTIAVALSSSALILGTYLLGRSHGVREYLVLNRDLVELDREVDEWLSSKS